MMMMTTLCRWVTLFASIHCHCHHQQQYQAAGQGHGVRLIVWNEWERERQFLMCPSCDIAAAVACLLWDVGWKSTQKYRIVTNSFSISLSCLRNEFSVWALGQCCCWCCFLVNWAHWGRLVLSFRFFFRTSLPWFNLPLMMLLIGLFAQCPCTISPSPSLLDVVKDEIKSVLSIINRDGQRKIGHWDRRSRFIAKSVSLNEHQQEEWRFVWLVNEWVLQSEHSNGKHV